MKHGRLFPPFRPLVNFHNVIVALELEPPSQLLVHGNKLGMQNYGFTVKHYRNTPHLFIPLQNSCYPAADERPIGGNKWAILPQPHFSPFTRFYPRSLRGGLLEIDLSLHEGEGRLQQVSSSLIALLLLSLLGLKGSYNYCPIHDRRMY